MVLANAFVGHTGKKSSQKVTWYKMDLDLQRKKMYEGLLGQKKLLRFGVFN